MQFKCVLLYLNKSFSIFIVKPGVLRFGPPTDTEPSLSLGTSRLSTNNAALSSVVPLLASPLRTTTGPLGIPPHLTPSAGSGLPTDPTHSGGAFVSVSTGGVQLSVSSTKAPKKRKEGGTASTGDFDTSCNRDDVQSPAYSDISDDSTPVAEAEIIGKI